MTIITPEAIIGAVVEDITKDGDNIVCISLRTHKGHYVDVWASDCHECGEDNISLEVL